MYYPYDDPSNDPRFQEDTRLNEELKEKEENEKYEDLRDGRDIDFDDRDKGDARDEQLNRAYEDLRASMSYNEFKSMNEDLRNGRMTNEDVLRMAREIKR